jgi:DNA polymerase III subunit delta'
MYFKDIIGNQIAKEQMMQMVQSGRIPHASIINSAKGVGALPMAIAYARYIMCKNKAVADACGTCAICIKIDKLQHIDLHFSMPTIKPEKKTALSANFIKEFKQAILQKPYMDLSEWIAIMDDENKKPNISAEECRQIIAKLQLRSFEGGYKILVVWLPEYLGNEGNILLKLIEEPPPKTVMIFATEHYENVLGTIQSRMQMTKLNPLTDDEIIAALVAKGVALAQAQNIARMAEGNYHLALSFFSQEPNEYLLQLKNLLNAAITNNGIGLNTWAIQVADKFSKDNQLQFLHYIIGIMEAMIRYKWVDSAKQPLTDEETTFINKLIEHNINEQKAELIAKICSKYLYSLERNVNAKTTFHSICIELKRAFHPKPLYL